MALPLMPKATAVWLVENTALTFDQIAEFCGLHPLEVKALADDEIGVGIIGSSPVHYGELTADEIARCEQNPTAKLKITKNDLPKPRARSKGPRYTPVSKRGDKPSAILYLTKKYPELTDPQICRLIGTTKPTVASVKDKTYPMYATLKPQDPVVLGLCTLDEMTKAVQKIERKKEREMKALAKAAKAAGLPVPEEAAAPQDDQHQETPVSETGT